MTKQAMKFDFDTLKQFELFQDGGVLVSKRIIYFGSEVYDEDGLGESGVDFASASRLIKNLTILETISHKPIEVIFSSPGGDWSHGMAIYDFIQAMKSKVTITCYGYCRSMGTIILQSATGKRRMSKNCRWMMHDGHEGHYGKPKDCQAWVDEGVFACNKMYEIYFEKMIQADENWTLAKIEKMCSIADTIKSAEWCLENNLIDEIV